VQLRSKVHAAKVADHDLYYIELYCAQCLEECEGFEYMSSDPRSKMQSSSAEADSG
jgi:hypothetical protein